MNKTRKVFLVIIMACVVMLFATACGKDNTPFKHGSWSGKTYTSDFLGLKLQLSSDWAVSSDADLAKAFGIADMSESNIQTIFDKGGIITEMMAGKASGTSINITVQDNSNSAKFTEKQYFDTAAELVKSQFEAMGLSCNVQKSSVNFLGKTTDCIELTVTINGQTLHELQVPIFKSHYTASITFGSYSKSEIYTLIAMASAI